MNLFKKMFWAKKNEGKSKEEAYSETRKEFQRITGKKPANQKTKCEKQTTIFDEVKRCF